MLRKTTLDTSGLDSATIARLRNPPTEPLTIDDDNEYYSSLQYIAAHCGSQDIYRTFQRNHNAHYPVQLMLSYEQVRSRLAVWSGVTPLMTAQCPKTCMAYTGPLADRETCIECGASRWDKVTLHKSKGKTKKPAREFLTVPIGPQIQALFRSPDMAKELMYLQNRADDIQRRVEAGESIQQYDDIVTGWEFIQALQRGIVKPHDVVFMESMDGAQLYRDKESDCWIIIFVLFMVSPENRYKKRLVLPGGIIGGPNAPKHMESFFYPGLYHISALQKEGLKIWNASTNCLYSSNLIYWLTSADSPGSIHMQGTVGHTGACPCRIFCGLKGRHKPGRSHHYLALLKPNNYTVPGCDFPDINPGDISGASATDYANKLKVVLGSRNNRDYEARRKQTGIVRPSILLGLQPSGITSVVSTFAGDTMHCLTLNMGELLVPLWRGIFTREPSDDLTSWTWAVLQGDAWKELGKAVAAYRPFIPGSYDCPPRNISDKVNSRYKAKEWQTFLYGYGPALLLPLLPHQDWKHFCRLVCGVRLILQRSISLQQVIEAQEHLEVWHLEYEVLYIQRRAERLHFLRPCVHGVLHFGLEIPRLCPSSLYSANTIERTVGNLGEEVKQPSNPFANLAQQALERAQINSIIAMIPALSVDRPVIPRGALDIGDGYVLLRARERYPHIIDGIQGQNGYQTCKTPEWARLRLPNGQISRSSWKECVKPIDELRRARCVQVLSGSSVAHALIQLYSPPDTELYEDSYRVLYSVTQLSEDVGLCVIPIKIIKSVVAVIPQDYHKTEPGDRWFVWERMGLDISMLQNGSIKDELSSVL
ncbi:hypothetical protein M422DRAFT_59584 [Sphaerobolus stellatus SS14]|uniref:Unplaced genomic scaffold SPHSTscaffold_31, whole genome shotgun sequence n=1 Tax=Sphaerobolus stellatus (strain SS14) TaxID=990650 RepID=A0A0C9VUJ0_SPHS4|nr:hypothetical protein M422DRAFT_59584 [Sphaerobolus stellatus SS14]